MMSRASTAWVCVALGGLATRAIAQSPVLQAPGGAGYTVSGTIADRQGSPVIDAEVALIERDSATRFARTDQNGRFRMSDLAEPSLIIRVRRLGFMAQKVPIEIKSGDRSATVFVTLEQSVAALDPMRVVDDEGDTALPDARLEGFYRRAQTNSFGRYITEAMIAKARPNNVSDLMRTLPGVVVRPTGRIGNTVRFRNCSVQRASPELVGPLVWVDGVRMPGAELDEVIQGDDVAAIEAYPALAGIPAQYFDRTAVCGTILVWTRAR
jgi:Carboxypeptidase regulatory-like domain/TonB-dependent Receptor Plug Domain